MLFGFVLLNGSSYAGVGGSFDFGEANVTGLCECKSWLGIYYELFEDGFGFFKEGVGVMFVEL